ncbi:Histidine kinase [Gammaproteobacteria bacterium]
MNKIDTKNLNSIIKTINRNIITSFLIILIFFVITAGVIFVNYKNSEKKVVKQQLNATFSVFTAKISQKLIDITLLDEFIHYLHSGSISRQYRIAALLNQMHHSGLNAISGMDIFSSSGVSIFTYGVKTNDSVTLELCYLNRKFLNFDVGTCSYSWKLYFQQDALIKELKRINPELKECDNCSVAIVAGKYFGDFPIREFSGMKVNLSVKNSPSTMLWEMVLFVVSSLLILVMWNVNRITSIFKKYLSDPIVEITSKIKENKSLPQAEVEELSYLTEQIDQWKKQIIELEKIKAKEKTKEAKVKIMQSIGASVAHELRTPIRSIISGVSGIEKFLPALLEGYDLARNANLLTKVIRPQQIELLHKVLANLKIEGAAANTIIDMLLMKIRGTITENVDVKILSIKECLCEALQRYAFQGSERDLIVCDTTNDFQFEGNQILVVHILFNLLKNALYYIASAHKGQIYIHFEKGKNENMLYFKDTGKGVPKEVLPRIFNRFYSRTEGGVGIGLSFCKMAMEWMGGSITSQSIEGEYAEFVLHFSIPKE